MSRQTEYADALRERAKKVEECNSYLLYANFESDEHKMSMGEDCFKDYYEKVSEKLQEEISTLEKVDLIDYWNLNEYGRSNKKR